jgi:hypothetical protein
MDYHIFFWIGNVLCVIGTVKLINEVYRNRDVLKGYSLSGSTLTFMGVLTFMIAFTIMRDYISVMLSTIPMSYWGMVTFYLKNKGV